MNSVQIAFLRRLVAHANAADMDVGVSTNILAALLDEHDALVEALRAIVSAVQFEQAALDTYEATRGTEDWPNAGFELEQAGIATARCISSARAVLAKAPADA